MFTVACMALRQLQSTQPADDKLREQVTCPSLLAVIIASCADRIDTESIMLLAGRDTRIELPVV